MMLLLPTQFRFVLFFFLCRFMCCFMKFKTNDLKSPLFKLRFGSSENMAICYSSPTMHSLPPLPLRPDPLKIERRVLPPRSISTLWSLVSCSICLAIFCMIVTARAHRAHRASEDGRKLRGVAGSRVGAASFRVRLEGTFE